jgi:hypothetical protein
MPLFAALKKKTSLRSASHGFMGKIKSHSLHQDDCETDLPERMTSHWGDFQSGFDFHPASRRASDSYTKKSEIRDATVCLELCSRKRCNPKVREALADVLDLNSQLWAPEFRSILADAEKGGFISKKGSERLRSEFELLYGGRDVPGVPDLVDA